MVKWPQGGFIIFRANEPDYLFPKNQRPFIKSVNSILLNLYIRFLLANIEETVKNQCKFPEVRIIPCICFHFHVLNSCKKHRNVFNNKFVYIIKKLLDHLVAINRNPPSSSGGLRLWQLLIILQSSCFPLFPPWPETEAGRTSCVIHFLFLWNEKSIFHWVLRYFFKDQLWSKMAACSLIWNNNNP